MKLGYPKKRDEKDGCGTEKQTDTFLLFLRETEDSLLQSSSCCYVKNLEMVSKVKNLTDGKIMSSLITALWNNTIQYNNIILSHECVFNFQ